MDNQILPALETRRINTFSSTVIEDFIMGMEEREVGLATQQNAFGALKKVLLDAHRPSNKWHPTGYASPSTLCLVAAIATEKRMRPTWSEWSRTTSTA
ncbi:MULTISPECIES: hypothetical protein [unclassified Streptomyces]|uniref:hypothetical protein n=1 Tax=unclassified Streptomyces TaxID=2593676 RepID=UPI002E75BB43|nr:hypothetical protein [Streptomyces sp. JV176]MEE1801404.1 hypothetical protein [Streptomyces sp. JV176]